MERIIIDGDKMTSVQEVHEFLKQVLDFPEYYGNNLNALWDMLTDAVEPIEIHLINQNKFRDNLGQDAETFIDVFRDAQNEYGCVKLKID